MFGQVDAALVNAFVERWQPDTNSFHMPFSEMKIIMHDVWHILSIPVEGRMIFEDPITSDMQNACMELMQVIRKELLDDH